ncbi:MAG: hypothetical protein HYX33_01760 [Actinobacteria bacterium]|nr:hypothetical protein [Actinomycetota bacterium]
MKEQHTTQIVLPSGKVIEVIYVAQGGAAPDSTPTIGAPHEVDNGAALHACPNCASDLVYPVWWDEADDGRWSVERRCPSCEWRHTGEYNQDTVDAFDDVLTDATETMLRTLREVSEARMATDVDNLIMAIHADLILPMDF